MIEETVNYPSFGQLRHIPVHREVRITKRVLPALPSHCESTSLGDPQGAIAQYRCRDNIHVREYADTWLAHRDYEDPRKDFIAHLVKDCPGSLTLCGAAVAALFVGLARKDWKKAVDAGAKIGGILLLIELLAQPR